LTPPERRYGKREGEKRIVIIGDSFTDGSEVDDTETFSWRIEDCLQGVQVINLGVYGYSTAQELLVFERLGMRYHPDLVVLVTVSNDFVGNVMALESFGPAPRFILDGNNLKFEGTSHPSARAAFRATNLPAPSIVHRNSLVYFLVNKHIYQPLIADKIIRTRRARAAELTEGERLELYERLVSRLAERAGDIGATLVVVFGYQESELAVGNGSPNRDLIARLRQKDIRTVDLYDGLGLNQRKRGSLYVRA
jgi:hypothetical protein